MTSEKKPVCPYCKEEMKKWKVPVASTWENEFFYVCFNENCPYFIEGWQYMWETQKTYASYRCKFDPNSGKYMPLPAWSVNALKENIMD